MLQIILRLEFASEPDWLSNNVNGGTLFNGNSVDVELTFHSEDYPLEIIQWMLL